MSAGRNISGSLDVLLSSYF